MYIKINPRDPPPLNETPCPPPGCVGVATDRVHEFRLLLVAHGDDGQHQVDQVEGTEEDDNCEEDHVDRTPGSNNLK